jgi:hypothetical protein
MYELVDFEENILHREEDFLNTTSEYSFLGVS